MQEGPVLDCRKQLQEAALNLRGDLVRGQSRLKEGRSGPATPPPHMRLSPTSLTRASHTIKLLVWGTMTEKNLFLLAEFLGLGTGRQGWSECGRLALQFRAA